MLRLVYGAGLRRSEVCGLKWRDLQPRTDGGQATIFCKGGKTRVVLLPSSLWRSLVTLRGNAGPGLSRRAAMRVYRGSKEAAAKCHERPG
jgi:integrase